MSSYQPQAQKMQDDRGSNLSIQEEPGYPAPDKHPNPEPQPDNNPSQYPQQDPNEVPATDPNEIPIQKDER